MQKIIGLLLVIASVIVAGGFVYVATTRNLTALENVLLQLFTMGLGLAGSYVIGRESARDMAKEMIRPHARSAFRRLTSLYRSLTRLMTAIQTARSDTRPAAATNHVLDKLEGIVMEQIATADDALEDWKDIIPEEIEKLRIQMNAQTSMEIGQ